MSRPSGAPLVLTALVAVSALLVGGPAAVEPYNAGGGGEFSTQTVRADAYLY